MNQKIKEALQLTYKSLGLNEELFEWVATSAETFTTEENLSNFVDGAEGLLKHYQSIVDKGRREASDEKKRADDLATKLAEAEAKLKTPAEPTEGKTEIDIAKLLDEKLSALVQPLKDELANIKHTRSAEDAFNLAKTNFFSNDYAKKYTDERDQAWERAVEINDLTGKKMSAEELQTKAMGYFNNLVSKKGVDTSKPFESEGEGGKDFDVSIFRKGLEASGRIPKKE